MPSKGTTKKLKIIEDSPKKKTPLKSKKICAERKTKEFPNVYTLLELKKLALNQGHDRTVIRSIKSRKDLCDLLNIEWNSLSGKITWKNIGIRSL